MHNAAVLREVMMSEDMHSTHDFLKNTIVLFDDTYPSSESFDIVYKYRNNFGKWAFKWVKKIGDQRLEYSSEFIYDDIIAAKNNRLVFMKAGYKGFWYYNTRTEFFYP